MVLAADEFRKLSGFLEEGMRDVANMARERNIRLLVATQHPGQIPEGMRADLLVSSAVKAYFNPGGDAVDATARYLAEASGAEEAVGSRTVTELTTPAPPSPAAYRGKLYARHVDRLNDGLIPLKAGYPPPSAPLFPNPRDPAEALCRFAAYAPDFLPPLCLEDGRRVREILRDLPDGSAFLLWRNGAAFVEIVPPALPALPPATKPTTATSRAGWTGVLRSLGKGDAVVVVGNASPRQVRIERVTPPEDAPTWYVEQSRQAATPPVTETPTPPPPSDGTGHADARTGSRRRRPSAPADPPPPPRAEAKTVRQPAWTPVTPQHTGEFTDDARSID